MVTVSLMVLVTGDGVQVARVTPFQRPAGVDPTEHRNFCMAHVARLPECCVNSEPASGTAVTRGKVADRPVAVVS